jgi:uncharacterized membrane protein YdbT with pleckstrin-like domain
MSNGWWFMSEGERIVWQGRPRLSAAFPGVSVGTIICLLAIGAGVLVDVRFAAVGVLGVGVASWALLRVRRTTYLVTSRAVWVKQGVVGRTVRRVGVTNIQNTALNQSVTGSAFGYGTVTLEVAGGRDIRFRRIENPETVRSTITDRLSRTDNTVPGTTAQWQSVLQLVREMRNSIPSR